MRDEIDRREFLKRTALTGGVVATAGTIGLADLLPAEAATGALWGALALPRGGQSDQQDAVRALERAVGRRFATTHYRMPWTSDLVNNFTRWSARSGHNRQILSWFARTQGGTVSWRAIANGQHDGWITRQARSLRGTGWSGYFCFHKEPEDEGNPDDWKAAYGRVRRIFANVGVRRFRWVVCLMASTYSAGQAGQWIPRRYDLLGVDGYNRNNCGGSSGWRSFSKIIGPAYAFARNRDRKLYVIEYGCVEGTAGAKAKWLDSATATIRRWPRIVGVSYNHENTDCNYYADSSGSALRAFRSMGQRAYFGG
jgi:hypothetical protein